MKSFKFIFSLLLVIAFIGCRSVDTSSKKETLQNNYIKGNSIAFQNTNDTTFVNLKDISGNFIFDMKYATKDNFLKQIVYDCGDCYLRFKTIKSLIKANKDFIKLGYKIKIFDCYRPLDIQKKMWELVPNPIYVADPKKGSIHNRGGAVDITLVDFNGSELDMGTSFDFFGEEASHNYQNLSIEVLKNRKKLKEIMLKNDFKSFDSEWWHYNLASGLTEKISNFKWECN